MFQLTNHTLAYGTNTVLDNISLHINSGERVALIGSSGSGKTTLLKALYQQCPEGVALCPQRYGLVETLSVYHNIYMGQLDRHNALYNFWNLIRPIHRHQRAIQKLADELGLGEKLNHSADRLSGGQQQRLAIGRALYRQQTTFIGDEPVSSLDTIQGLAILKTILSRHTTVLMALHNRKQALSLFDRVIALNNGVIQFDQPTRNINAKQLSTLYGE